MRARTLFVTALALALLQAGCETKRSHTYIANLKVEELAPFAPASAHPAVVVEGEVLPPPLGGPLRREDERPMLAGPGDGVGGDPPGRRSPAFRPDRITELEGTLGYYEVFTPGITPFKRVSALDAVSLLEDVPVLGVSDPQRVAVPVENLSAAAPDARERDRFWGSVVLDLSEGRSVPLPSVSPESRILSLTSEPSTQITIERDAADNFFAVARGDAAKQVRVTYLMDAPKSYFAAPLPITPTDALAAQVFPLPPSVARAALTFAGELGVMRGMPVDVALRVLVEHFRSFEESKQPPRDTGDIFLDLARGRRGVCRHRVYGFVITALALGIPTRFVQNEAHAWAELKLPGLGWMRLDLGGAARGLEAHAAGERPPYHPTQPDPWPRPLAYEESYSRAFEAPAGAGAAGAGTLQRGGTRRDANTTALKPTLARRTSEPQVAVEDGREPLTLRVTRYAPEVMRGGALELEGEVRGSEGVPVSGLRIEVSLAKLDDDSAVLLGVAVSDAAGHFKGRFAVPPQLDPSDYALVVVTPGDATYGAARAE